jgi:hypothetical protein
METDHDNTHAAVRGKNLRPDLRLRFCLLYSRAADGLARQICKLTFEKSRFETIRSPSRSRNTLH